MSRLGSLIGYHLHSQRRREYAQALWIFNQHLAGGCPYGDAGLRTSHRTPSLTRRCDIGKSGVALPL